LEFGDGLRKNEACQKVTVWILLAVDEVQAGRDPERMAQNLGLGMGRRLEPDDLRSQDDGAVIGVMGPVIDCGFDRHSNASLAPWPQIFSFPRGSLAVIQGLG